MKPDEALNIVKRLQNHYRAFEKLEEVLIMVQQSENILRDHEKRKAQFANEIAELKAEQEKGEASLATFTEKWNQTRQDTIKRINGELSTLQEKSREETQSIQSQLEALKTTLADAEKSYSERIVQLKQEEKQVEKELSEARAELDQFKAEMKNRFKFW